MSRIHVDHKDIAKFAQEKVNLPKAKADEYRAQARRLREKLENYLNEHPDFFLKKMMVSGSLAKGTGLRSLNKAERLLIKPEGRIFLPSSSASGQLINRYSEGRVKAI